MGWKKSFNLNVEGEPDFSPRLNEVENKIGNTMNLYTQNKDNLVEAINETSSDLAHTTTEIDMLESNKMEKNTTDIGISQINKNRGLIDQTFLAENLLQQITGNAPVNSIPNDDSILSRMLTRKSVTFPKLSNDSRSILMTNKIKLIDEYLWEQYSGFSSTPTGDWQQDKSQNDARFRIKDLIPMFDQDFEIIFNDDDYEVQYYLFNGEIDQNRTSSSWLTSSPVKVENSLKNSHIGISFRNKSDTELSLTDIDMFDCEVVSQSSKDIKQLSDDVKNNEIGIFANNIIINGDFSRGLRSWGYYSNHVNAEISGEYIRFTPPNSGAGLAQSFVPTEGHVYYFSAVVRAETVGNFVFGFGKVGTGVNIATKTALTSDTKLSDIIVPAGDRNQIVYGRRSTTFWLKEPLVLDLTEIFGEGKEPSKEEFEELLQTVGANWFERKNLIDGRLLLDTTLRIIEEGMPKDKVEDALYFHPELEELTSELMSKVALDDKDYDFEFAFITDSHAIDDSLPSYQGKGDLHCRSVAEFSHLKNMDLAIHGGDLTYDYVPKTDFMRNLSRNIKEMRRVINAPVMIAQGNHDTGDDYYWDQYDWGGWSGEPPTPDKVVSPIEWSNLMGYDKSFVYGDYSKSYYYKDFDTKKMRVIVLNTNDTWFLDEQGRVKYNRTAISDNAYGFKQEQLSWLADTALDFEGKEGWGVIIVSHAPFDVETASRPVKNGLVALEILKARKNRTSYTSTATTGEMGQNISVDYTNAEPVMIVGGLSGHIHSDRIRRTDGIVFVTTTWSRNPNDDYDGAWDYIQVKRDEGKVYLKRFGNRGTDREFNI
ncbi:MULTISPECIES: metallophosphoesterase family protein [Bacillaceae]|uniref:Metallophosphoesterase n=1 Tax=Evansella alkalicola TaxID=745819 RepID=A0ABS6JZU8_9BACI|nr:MULTISPECIES: metallophosphoesterase [Bacillaceae]MBU9724116.1 metallophosphoesterase [Bacillus alkalicola]